jgi:DNA repair protein RecO (recombination protein O)
MDKKTTAFVLRASDYKENDKLLTLLCAEYGKITASLRGAKKPNAKLKFASQPFSLIEFVLSERGGYHTVTQAQAADMFYPLRADVNKFYAASAMAQLVLSSVQEGSAEPLLFSLVGEAFKNLCYEKTDARLLLIRFLMDALQILGVGAGFSFCATCNEAVVGATFFSFDSGAVFCEKCAPKAAVLLKTEVSDLLCAVQTANVSDLIGKKADKEAERGALRLLGEYAEKHLDIHLTALYQYLELA